MNADDALRSHLGRGSDQKLDYLSEDEIVDLVIRFGIWPSTDSYIKAPWLARYALRRQRYRIDERAPGEKRDLWGMPDEAGYFADDNSLLKSTFKNLSISGDHNPFGIGKISTGLVCCHIWPNTTGNPLLFSFLPNLVWLPKSLSRFTDVFQDKPVHKVHYVLQELSHRRYKNLKALTGVEECKTAWELLTRPVIDFALEPSLNEMNSEPSLSKRVLLRHTRLLDFLDASLSEPPRSQRRFSKRYHLGFGSGIDKSVPPITEIVTKIDLAKLRRIIHETTPHLTDS